MKKEELERFLSRKGYKKDRWAHYHKGDIRYKMQKISVRVENKMSFGWVKRFTEYYKNLEISENDKLRTKK